MTIRNHIVPRKYLTYFGMIQDSSLIWRYSIERLRWHQEPVSIRKASRRVDFYPPAVESQLTKIENRALRPLDQLRIGQQLDYDERLAVGIYVVTMIERVERTRVKKRDSLKEQIANVRSNSKGYATRIHVPEELLLNCLDEKEEMLQEDPLRTRDTVL